MTERGPDHVRSMIEQAKNEGRSEAIVFFLRKHEENLGVIHTAWLIATSYRPLDYESLKLMLNRFWDEYLLPELFIDVFVDSPLGFFGSPGGSYQHKRLEELDVLYRPVVAENGEIARELRETFRSAEPDQFTTVCEWLEDCVVAETPEAKDDGFSLFANTDLDVELAWYLGLRTQDDTPFLYAIQNAKMRVDVLCLRAGSLGFTPNVNLKTLDDVLEERDRRHEAAAAQ